MNYLHGLVKLWRDRHPGFQTILGSCGKLNAKQLHKSILTRAVYLINGHPVNLFVQIYNFLLSLLQYQQHHRSKKERFTQDQIKTGHFQNFRHFLNGIVVLR